MVISPGMMAHFYHLICILLIVKLDFVSSADADCLESEFEDEQGNCIPCKQCGPGYELSEDCGSGRESQCLPCRPGRYKEDRGHHHCLRCLNCAVINRSLKANCSLTSNSICGDCLPGFYSKTRIGGFRELECFPCTAHTPRSESQCYPRPGPGQPTSTTPPRDPVLLVAIIMVALSLILVTLVTFSVICCGRFLKSQFQRAFRRSQDLAGQPDRINEGQRESAHSPHGEHQGPPLGFGSTGISGQMQGPLEEGQVISKSITSNSCTVSTALCSLPPSVELCAIPPPPVKPHYSRSVSETQPLIRNSGCSDCFSGCGPSPDPNQGVIEPLSTQTHSCASEKQHWFHAPVECTELDLENFSSEDASQAHPRTDKNLYKETGLHLCSCTTSAESTTKDEICDDLVSGLDSATLGLPISQIPGSLLVLLAHKLDTMTPGVKDFRDIGIDLGVQPHLVERMTGFIALHDHLSSNIACTLQHLVHALQRLQRRDALALICSHFSQ